MLVIPRTTIFIMILMAVSAAAAAGADDSARVSGSITDSTITSIKYKSLFAEHISDSTRSQNPTMALFKSMLIPGWGQVGNKKYIKAVVFAGLESLAFGAYWHYRTKAEDARTAFEAAAGGSQAALYREYEDARKERNRFAWYTGSLIFISMFDAYVDAHLIHFPKRDQSLSMKLVPSDKARPALAISYNF